MANQGSELGSSVEGGAGVANFWPVKLDGELDPALFSVQDLQNIFFEFLPMRFKCAPAEMGRALKALIKRQGPSAARGLSGEEREGWLAMRASNTAVARGNLRNLSIRFGNPKLGGRSNRALTPKLRFQDLVWQGMCSDPDKQLLTSWLRKKSSKRPELGNGYFLPTDSLKSESWVSEIPGGIDSREFAQAIVLLAAQLPAEETQQMLRDAGLAGCSYIRWSVEDVGRHQQCSNEEKIEAPEPPRTVRDVEFLHDIMPSFDEFLRAVVDNSRSDVSGTSVTKDLLSAIKAYEESIKSIEDLSHKNVCEIVEISADRYESLLDKIAKARVCKFNVGQRRKALEGVINVEINGLQTNLRLKVDSPNIEESSVSQLIRAADEIVYVSEVCRRAKKAAAQPIPDDLRESSTVSEAFECASAFDRRLQWTAAAMDYALEFKSYVREIRDPKGMGRLLKQLSSAELIAIASSETSIEWRVFIAIMIRFSMDVGVDRNAAFAIQDALLSEDSVENRRALMYFMRPEHGSLFASKEIQRIFALEYIRDSLEFGPMARLAEPHGFITDPGISGVLIPEIVALILTNADRIRSLVDTARLLRPPGSRQAERALKAFVLSPASMTGNFRRLKEKAREDYLLPLLDNGKISKRRALDLAADFSEDNIVDSVIASLSIERLGEIDTRHRESLRRYLLRGKSLLADYADEDNGQAGERDKSIQRNLSRLHSKLAKGGVVGQLQWLESEVSLLLAGGTIAAERPTMSGSDLPLRSAILSEEDLDWIRSEIDLPLAYRAPDSTTALCIAEDILMWWVGGSLPTSHQVVEDLVAREAYSAALMYAEMKADDELLKLLSELIRPKSEDLHARVKRVFERYGQGIATAREEYEEYEKACKRLDLHTAAEAIELLDIALDQRLSAEQRSLDERASASAIVAKLSAAGERGVETGTSLVELQERWAGVRARDAKRRIHLDASVAALNPIKVSLPELTEHFTAFLSLSEDPASWLTEAASSDFLHFTKTGLAKLSKWLESAHLIKLEERRALSHLCEWFMIFVTDSTKLLHDLDNDDSIASVLGRMMEVDDCIERADAPSACIRNLNDMGETVSAIPGESLAVGGLATERLDAVKVGQFDTIPEDLALAITTERWSDVAELGSKWTGRLSVADSEFMSRIVSAADALSGESDSATIDAEIIEFAATLISATVGTGRQLTDARKSVLAQRLVASACRQELKWNFGSRGEVSWVDIVGVPAGLKRALLSGADGLISRTLSVLMTGLVGEAVAKAIWDAATNLSDAASTRSSLLSKLSELDLNALVIKLVQRADHAIAPRLQQLLDLRRIASSRSDLVPVVLGVTSQLIVDTKSSPVRSFLKSLPLASQSLQVALNIKVDGRIRISTGRSRSAVHEVTLAVTPSGLVPEKLEAVLSEAEDVTFADGSHRFELSGKAIYMPTEFTISLAFGASWGLRKSTERSSVRIRVRARLITSELISTDVEVEVSSSSQTIDASLVLDDDSLLDAYPGVTNTPAVGDAFVGRFDEMERLHALLIASRRPSPVMLVGLRRIGKTSLLFAFHKRHCRAIGGAAVSVYLSLAERKIELLDDARSVSEVVYRSIIHSLVRPNLGAADENVDLASKIRASYGGDWKLARASLQECYDEESLADSILAVRSLIANVLGAPDLRVVLLIDEAEALAGAHNFSGKKCGEVEQLLQSIREVSQRSDGAAVLLSGSNHINLFSRNYKNAFFGSSQVVNLHGLARESAPDLVAPSRVASYVQFDEAAISYAHKICDGMPQFMWQVGAASAALMRSGPIARSDVRRAISLLNSGELGSVPFRTYDFLEPVESILALEDPRERDLLWLLLSRIASASSLISEDAPLAFVIDSSLGVIDDREGWFRRCTKLADLRLVEIKSPGTVSFKIPLFAEGFRAPRNVQEFNIRLQRVSR